MTDLESFIVFEDRLNNFWVIKSKEYCWKKVYQNKWFFFVRGFWCSRVNLFIWFYMNVV